MRLVSVYESDGDSAAMFLYELLAERKPEESISHKAMPTYAQHCLFIEGHPYLAWYIVENDVGFPLGAVYISRQRELGVSIAGNCRKRGFGEQALRELMRRHPGRFLANINPDNRASIALFRKLGFGPEPIQHTFAKES